VNNVSYSYDGSRKAVDNVSLSIPQGSYTTIIGHNGSGKSTMAKLLLGLLPAQGGSISILGTPLNENTVYDIRAKAGIVFQNPDNQFIGSTVADDIAFGLENRCVPQENMQAIIEESAAKVGMSDFLDAEPTKLSGGQKQRVAIAGILAVEPELIIFDESTSMLDPEGKQAINAQIKALHDRGQFTILSITHDMEEAAQSDHVIVMKEGKAVMEGTPAEIFAQEEALADMQLDVPFSWKFSKQLVHMGKLDKPVLLPEHLTEELCRLKQNI
jgi:energy-coupling factor transport system ATP-binding protein